MTPNKGDYRDTHKQRPDYVHPSAVFFDNITNGREITLSEIERRAGGHIDIKLLTAEMARRGFERSYVKGPPKYVRRSWDAIEPYRKPEPCGLEDLRAALEFHKLTADVSWRNIVAALGFHPRRDDVAKHLKTLGFVYDRRRARWDSETSGAAQSSASGAAQSSAKDAPQQFYRRKPISY